eukprot:CAMPEP_0185316974 /NCGR_PEP_ID=MMETSP1363-20130426/45524_1 /TAXON_ID=38817 /ORGANISM="Gephyrocapsa oceanica, Strain RCC1303" /LENGTH=132 /DNA_ID=CAMNT_0027915209 /DNA_START=67 /DNA_END=466 /DNA_ORIENTATION=-
MTQTLSSSLILVPRVPATLAGDSVRTVTRSCLLEARSVKRFSLLAYRSADAASRSSRPALHRPAIAESRPPADRFRVNRFEPAQPHNSERSAAMLHPAALPGRFGPFGPSEAWARAASEPSGLGETAAEGEQ